VRQDDQSGTLKELVSSLVGCSCWSATCCGAAGPSLMLDVGNRIPRREPVTNPTMSPEQRMYEGEYRLFIECAWRLERNDEVICGSQDEAEHGGPMALAIRAIVSRAIRHADVQGPAWDLTLTFADDLRLRIFCDQTNINIDDFNYSISTGSTSAEVGPRGQVQIARRRTN
jgi:hypothetical protein